jgi:bacterioferritin (cytochrome b1)
VSLLTEHELWILSFYRASEISGALFFGRLAKSMRPGRIQHDLTKHFADESAHAWYWTDCIDRLGGQPLKLREAYQDAYLEAAGMPVNMMEVLAITQIFEQRVISQYSIHSQIPGLEPQIKETLERIMQDEKWHIEWIRDALLQMEEQFGHDVVEATVKRFRNADKEVYTLTMKEHEERIADLMKSSADRSEHGR